jgi:hypothetical protein
MAANTLDVMAANTTIEAGRSVGATHQLDSIEGESRLTEFVAAFRQQSVSSQDHFKSTKSANVVCDRETHGGRTPSSKEAAETATGQQSSNVSPSRDELSELRPLQLLHYPGLTIDTAGVTTNAVGFIGRPVRVRSAEGKLTLFLLQSTRISIWTFISAPCIASLPALLRMKATAVQAVPRSKNRCGRPFGLPARLSTSNDITEKVVPRWLTYHLTYLSNFCLVSCGSGGDQRNLMGGVGPALTLRLR